MRLFLLSLGALTLLSVQAHARPLTEHDRQLCKWGGQIAGSAQQAKLSGVNLYTQRKRLQNHRFAKSWMRMTAMGITEQTYSSRSQLPPADINKTYTEQCIQHSKNKK
ncbi:hypothetical protein ACSMEV_14170 [Pseudomonas sp. MLB6B]